MPVKSHSNTKKKKSLTNTQKKKSGSNKSGTAKRSKNRSRKGGAKIKTTSKKSPSPSPESSGDDEDNYFHQIFTDDGRVKRHNVEVDTFATLPTPKYTAESKKETDIAMYANAINRFYNERADVQALKAKPTDTKIQREKKKQKFATFPKRIEDSIFDKIKKQMQPELDAWDKQNAKRDAEFGELTDKINQASRHAGKINYDMQQAVNAEYDWVNREWKPEEYPNKVFGLDDIKDPQARARAAYHDDGPVAEGDEHNPRTDIENVRDTRIGNLSKYIQTKWDAEWEDAKPKSGRKMTDMLVEDFSIPGVVAALDHEDNLWEWDTNNMEIYDIQRWNAKWEKANNKEYKESDEFEENIKKEMKKTNKNRTTVVAELNRNIAAEEKIRADAQEKEKIKIAAAADKKQKDEAAANRPSRKELMRKRMNAKIAAEEATRPKKLRISNTAQKISATPMPPVPPAQKISATPMPPAAGDGPTPMTTTEPSPISSTDAYKLANENEHITIHQSKSNPEMSYMLNNETNVSTWIVGEGPSGLYQSTQTPGKSYSINKQGTSVWLGTNEFSRVDAENAVNTNPSKFEIRNHPEGGFDYLINKETGAVVKIFD